MAVVRIAGVTLAPQKHSDVALAALYGIGRPVAIKILSALNIPATVKVDALTNEQANAIREIVEKQYVVEGELRRRIMMNVKRLKDIGCYRGMRHIKNLPVRGQRTRTNSRTRRGNVRRTMGSGRRKAADKT